MSKKEKLIREFMSSSAKNKTYRDLITLANYLHLEVIQGYGSNFKLVDKNGRVILQLHRKDNNSTFLNYEIKIIRKMIEEVDK